MSSSRCKLQLVASFGLLVLIAVISVGCNGFFVDPILQTITVGPTGVGILGAKTQQMTAIGTYDDGTQKNITGSSTTTWTSNDATSRASRLLVWLRASAPAPPRSLPPTALQRGRPASQCLDGRDRDHCDTFVPIRVRRGNDIPFCLQAIAHSVRNGYQFDSNLGLCNSEQYCRGRHH